MNASDTPVPAAVDLPKAYRLLNHGPTVLVSAAHGSRRNLMAAAWSVPLEFDPPRIGVVIDKSTYTRELVEASGSFALSVPCRALARQTMAVGTVSGRDLADRDKFEACAVSAFAGPVLGLPLVEGCVGWLECRVIVEPHNQSRYDLFIGEAVSALADPRVFTDGRWHFDDGQRDLRTIHYIAGGRFFAIGEAFDAN